MTDPDAAHLRAARALSAGEEIGWVAKQLGQDGSAFDKAAAQVGL